MNTLQPAKLWRKNTAVSESIQNFVSSQQFREAAVYALAEYAREVGFKPDAGARVLGANDFLDKLLTLGEEPTKRTVPSFNLPEPI